MPRKLPASKVLDRVLCGEPQADIGQITKEDKRALDAAIRAGRVKKIKAYWAVHHIRDREENLLRSDKGRSGSEVRNRKEEAQHRGPQNAAGARMTLRCPQDGPYGIKAMRKLAAECGVKLTEKRTSQRAAFGWNASARSPCSLPKSYRTCCGQITNANWQSRNSREFVHFPLSYQCNREAHSVRVQVPHNG